MAYNYWIFGLRNQSSERSHSVRLKHQAAVGHTLTYNDDGVIYNIVDCQESMSDFWGTLRVVQAQRTASASVQPNPKTAGGTCGAGVHDRVAD